MPKAVEVAERIKLSGGLEKTITWIQLENHQLAVEYYDFSESAQEIFGNDVAYIIPTVTNCASRLLKRRNL